MTLEKGAKSRVGIVNFERRKHPRFSIDLPVEYDRVESPVLLGRAIDASEGGLLIVLPERLEVGQHLRLRLFLSMGAELNTIEALTEVVWMEVCLAQKRGDYRSGVKFLRISPEDFRKLKDFLGRLGS